MAALAVFGPVWASSAATIRLLAYTTFALTQVGGTPLPDGSIIEIIGSGDAIQDGHVPFGGGFAWGTTLGDDIILASTVVDSSLGAGTFFQSLTYDDTVVNNLYIRFYDITAPPLGSNGQTIAWGSSAVFAASSFFGVDFQDFTPTGPLDTPNTNVFFVVPEPGSFSILAFMGLVLVTCRMKWFRLWWREMVAGQT